MRKLVAICHAAESETDAARRLYNWFTQYRKDVLVDTESAERAIRRSLRCIVS